MVYDVLCVCVHSSLTIISLMETPDKGKDTGVGVTESRFSRQVAEHIASWMDDYVTLDSTLAAKRTFPRYHAYFICVSFNSNLM